MQFCIYYIQDFLCKLFPMKIKMMEMIIIWKLSMQHPPPPRVKELIKTKTPNDLVLINKIILEKKPDSEDRLKYYNKTRDEIDPSRSDLTTWVDLMDLEEGRFPPKVS